MRRLAQFGLIALIPAAFNISSSAASPIMVPLCTGDGRVQMVPISGGGSPMPGSETGACCVKGCHGGSSRKKSSTEFEPSQ